MFDFKKLVSGYLRKATDSIDGGTSEISETEAMDIMSVIAHEPLSKEQACLYLNVSRSKFGELIRTHVIPKGRKVTGHHELRWYKDELMRCKDSVKRT